MLHRDMVEAFQVGSVICFLLLFKYFHNNIIRKRLSKDSVDRIAVLFFKVQVFLHCGQSYEIYLK